MLKGLILRSFYAFWEQLKRMIMSRFKNLLEQLVAATNAGSRLRHN